MLAKKTSFQLLTLHLREGYSKWFVKISVCVSVSDSALPQKLDTPGLGMYTLLRTGKNEHSLIFSPQY